MPDQTISKKEASNAADTSNSNAEIEKGEKGQIKGQKEKKMGFFEKWRASTTKAYEKHRAAGGNF